MFDQDGVAVARWAIEADHHQVQVHRQRVHCDNLARQGAGDVGQAITDKLVIGHPGVPSLEVPLDAKRSPVVEFIDQGASCCLGLQAERVAAEIRLVAALMLWDMELAAEVRQRVGCVERDGSRRNLFNRRHVHEAKRDEGTASHSSAAP